MTMPFQLPAHRAPSAPSANQTLSLAIMVACALLGTQPAQAQNLVDLYT